MLVGLLPPPCVITLGHESSNLAANQVNDRPTEKYSGTWGKILFDQQRNNHVLEEKIFSSELQRDWAQQTGFIPLK